MMFSDKSHDVFKKFIAEDIGNVDRLLIYADWCDEQGDPRGELIRLLVEVREQLGAHPRWKQFLLSIKNVIGTIELNDLTDHLDQIQQRLFACQAAESVICLIRGTAFRELCKTIEATRRYAIGKGNQREFELAAVFAARIRRGIMLSCDRPGDDGTLVYAASSVVAAAWGNHLSGYHPGYDIGPHATVTYARKASRGDFDDRYLVWNVERILGLRDERRQ